MWCRAVLMLTFLPTCWLLMQVVHECGHVIAGWMLGGTVQKVVLHPFAISRTDVSGDSMPLWTCWAGPMLGVLLPGFASWVWNRWKLTGWRLV